MRHNLPCSRAIHNPGATIACSIEVVNVGKKLQFVMPASRTLSGHPATLSGALKDKTNSFSGNRASEEFARIIWKA